MHHDEFANIITGQTEHCLDILTAKGAEYATEMDRLHNFRVAQHVLGVPMRKALAGMMVKHTTSVYDLCMSNELAELHIWQEKITDHINYLLLLKAVILEEGQEYLNQMKIELSPIQKTVKR